MIFDLTMPLSSGMPVYPGDPEVTVSSAAVLCKDGCNVSSLKMGTHSGTHVDMPLHFLDRGACCISVPLDRCMGSAFVAEGLIQDGEIHAPLSPQAKQADILLLSTGWEEKAGTGAFFQDIPPFSPGLARELLSYRAVGTDLPTVDRDGSIHKLLLREGILIYESLTGLKSLIGIPGYFYGFPLKIQGGDGSPVRAIFQCGKENET